MQTTTHSAIAKTAIQTTTRMDGWAAQQSFRSPAHFTASVLRTRWERDIDIAPEETLKFSP